MVSAYKRNNQDAKVKYKRKKNFNRMIKEGLFKVITLELGPEGREKACYMKGRKQQLQRLQCKTLACLRNEKTISVVRI